MGGGGGQRLTCPHEFLLQAVEIIGENRHPAQGLISFNHSLISNAQWLETDCLYLDRLESRLRQGRCFDGLCHCTWTTLLRRMEKDMVYIVLIVYGIFRVTQ